MHFLGDGSPAPTRSRVILRSFRKRCVCSCKSRSLSDAFLAGIPLQQAAGTKTAVFVGFCGSDYCALLCRDPETAPRYQTTGSAFSILANRVSYAFNLSGPSCTLDTACSSSLTAVHLACQSLRLGEAVQAIVGGVGVLLSPDMWSGMSSLGYLVICASRYFA